MLTMIVPIVCIYSFALTGTMSYKSRLGNDVAYRGVKTTANAMIGHETTRTFGQVPKVFVYAGKC